MGRCSALVALFKTFPISCNVDGVQLAGLIDATLVLHLGQAGLLRSPLSVYAALGGGTHHKSNGNEAQS